MLKFLLYIPIYLLLMFGSASASHFKQPMFLFSAQNGCFDLDHLYYVVANYDGTRGWENKLEAAKMDSCWKSRLGVPIWYLEILDEVKAGDGTIVVFYKGHLQDGTEVYVAYDETWDEAIEDLKKLGLYKDKNA